MHPALKNVGLPQPLIDLLNQVFEVEKKLERIDQPNSIDRNVRKMRELFDDALLEGQDAGLVYHSPLGEPYDETRTDCEASIAGDVMDNLVVIEVIKPIIYLKIGGYKQIVQKAVVIVESAANGTSEDGEEPSKSS